MNESRGDGQGSERAGGGPVEEGELHGRKRDAAGRTETGDTTRRLLDAGRELFAEHGLKGTSVRALTAAAGANLGAVTYHFQSKDALYIRVLEEVLRPIRDRVESLMDLPDPAPRRLELFVRGFFQHLRDNPDTPRFFVQEVVLGKEPAPPILDTVRAVVTTLTAIVREGQEEGSIREGDPVLMALSTLSQPIYLTVMTGVLNRGELWVGGFPQPRSSAEDHAVEFVLGSLLARREEHE